MPLILFHELKADLSKPTIIEVKDGENLMDCLEKYFPMGFGCDVEMYWDAVGGEPFFASESEFQSDLEVCINQNLHIVCLPKGFDPITLIYVAVAAVAAAVVVATTIDVPPNDVGNTKQSPNNQLNAQTNIARSGQAIPYIVGRVRSYPDLISEPVYEFVDNRLEITEQFCIGVGNHELSNFKSADTLISDLNGYSVESYQPGQFPSTPPLESFSADNIDGQELVAPNLSDETGDSASTTSGTIVTFTNEVMVFRVPTTPEWSVMQAKTLPYSVSIDYQRNVVDSSSGTPVDSIENTSGTGLITAAVIDTDGMGNPTGTLTFTASSFNGPVADPVITPTNPLYGSNITAAEKLDLTIGPFPTNAEANQLWFNFEFNRGLRTSVAGRIDIDQIDEDGDEIPNTRETFTFNYNADSFDPQFRTLKITPAGGNARYQFSLTRTSNSQDDANTPDRIGIQRVQAIRSTSVTTYGNVTWSIIKTRATQESATQSQRNFNVIATRMTKTFENGQVVDTLRASRKGADSILQVFTDANRNVTGELDLEQLYEIYNGLSDQRLGFCDFTFDDEDISLRQRIDTIAGSSRVLAYRSGQVWQFDRDELKQFRSFSITRRTVSASRSQAQTWRGQLPKSPDSVELKWRDVDGDNKDKFIYLVINQQQRRIDQVNEIGARRPKRLSISGITNEFQALNRAHLEVRKLVYERMSVKDTVMNDGYNIDIGQIGYWADVYERRINNGEILGYNNGVADTSERVIFQDGQSHFVTITNDQGEPQARVMATPRSDTDFGFNATLDGVVIADLNAIQVGSQYILTTETELDKSTFRLLSRSPKEGDRGQLLVDIELIQYDERVYEFDGEQS